MGASCDNGTGHEQMQALAMCTCTQALCAHSELALHSVSRSPVCTTMNPKKAGKQAAVTQLGRRSGRPPAVRETATHGNRMGRQWNRPKRGRHPGRVPAATPHNLAKSPTKR